MAPALQASRKPQKKHASAAAPGSKAATRRRRKPRIKTAFKPDGVPVVVNPVAPAPSADPLLRQLQDCFDDKTPSIDSLQRCSNDDACAVLLALARAHDASLAPHSPDFLAYYTDLAPALLATLPAHVRFLETHAVCVATRACAAMAATARDTPAAQTNATLAADAITADHCLETALIPELRRRLRSQGTRKAVRTAREYVAAAGALAALPPWFAPALRGPVRQWQAHPATVDFVHHLRFQQIAELVKHYGQQPALVSSQGQHFRNLMQRWSALAAGGPPPLEAREACDVLQALARVRAARADVWAFAFFTASRGVGLFRNRLGGSLITAFQDEAAVAALPLAALQGAAQGVHAIQLHDAALRTTLLNAAACFAPHGMDRRATLDFLRLASPHEDNTARLQPFGVPTEQLRAFVAAATAAPQPEAPLWAPRELWALARVLLSETGLPLDERNSALEALAAQTDWHGGAGAREKAEGGTRSDRFTHNSQRLACALCQLFWARAPRPLVLEFLDFASHQPAKLFESMDGWQLRITLRVSMHAGYDNPPFLSMLLERATQLAAMGSDMTYAVYAAAKVGDFERVRKLLPLAHKHTARRANMVSCCNALWGAAVASREGAVDGAAVRALQRRVKSLLVTTRVCELSGSATPGPDDFQDHVPDDAPGMPEVAGGELPREVQAQVAQGVSELFAAGVVDRLSGDTRPAPPPVPQPLQADAVAWMGSAAPQSGEAPAWEGVAGSEPAVRYEGDAAAQSSDGGATQPYAHDEWAHAPRADSSGAAAEYGFDPTAQQGAPGLYSGLDETAADGAALDWGQGYTADAPAQADGSYDAAAYGYSAEAYAQAAGADGSGAAPQYGYSDAAYAQQDSSSAAQEQAAAAYAEQDPELLWASQGNAAAAPAAGDAGVAAPELYDFEAAAAAWAASEEQQAAPQEQQQQQEVSAPSADVFSGEQYAAAAEGYSTHAQQWSADGGEAAAVQWPQGANAETGAETGAYDGYATQPYDEANVAATYSYGAYSDWPRADAQEEAASATTAGEQAPAQEASYAEPYAYTGSTEEAWAQYEAQYGSAATAEAMAAAIAQEAAVNAEQAPASGDADAMAVADSAATSTDTSAGPSDAWSDGIGGAGPVARPHVRKELILSSSAADADDIARAAQDTAMRAWLLPSIAWAVATLHANGHEAEEGVVSFIIDNIDTERLKPIDFTNVLHAAEATRVHVQAAQPFALSLIHALAQGLDGWRANELATVAFCLGCYKISPGAEVLESIGARLAAVHHSAPLTHVCNGYTGLYYLGHMPPPGAGRGLEARMLRNLDEATPDELAQVLLICTRLGHEPAQLLDALERGAPNALTPLLCSPDACVKLTVCIATFGTRHARLFSAAMMALSYVPGEAFDFSEAVCLQIAQAYHTMRAYGLTAPKAPDFVRARSLSLYERAAEKGDQQRRQLKTVLRAALRALHPSLARSTVNARTRQGPPVHMDLLLTGVRSASGHCVAIELLDQHDVSSNTREAFGQWLLRRRQLAAGGVCVVGVPMDTFSAAGHAVRQSMLRQALRACGCSLGSGDARAAGATRRRSDADRRPRRREERTPRPL